VRMRSRNSAAERSAITAAALWRSSRGHGGPNVADFGNERAAEHDDQRDRPISDAAVAAKQTRPASATNRFRTPHSPKHCHDLVFGRLGREGQSKVGEESIEVN
jgi:hypothetical protein